VFDTERTKTDHGHLLALLQRRRDAIDDGVYGTTSICFRQIGCTRYRIDQFLRDRANKRSDQYGGSIENRTRILREAMDAVTSAVGRERVGVRISPQNGQTVTNVPGVVTGLRTSSSKGFWFQDPTPDSDPATSEGLFVFTGRAVMESGADGFATSVSRPPKVLDVCQALA